MIWRLADPEGKGKKIERSTEDSSHAEEQGEPIYLLTVEIKTQKVLKEKLFSDIFQMPMDHRKGSHTMRFVWPKELSQQNDKETRIIIQVGYLITDFFDHIVLIGVIDMVPDESQEYQLRHDKQP